jgi:protein-S-isoprenylcysteine O-methyltransferase Ste14
MMSMEASVGPSWYRGFIQGKTRIVMAWVFAGLLGVAARDYPQWPGIVLCFLGASLRFWASGYLRKDSRPATGGPYAHVRNPLYLGTYIMAIGTAVSVVEWRLVATVTVLFAAVYHFIILDEEIKLVKIFGEPYRAYCKLVPRFFPRPLPASQTALTAVNPDVAEHRFSYSIATKNKAWEAYWSFLGLMAFVSLMAFIRRCLTT